MATTNEKMTSQHRIFKVRGKSSGTKRKKWIANATNTVITNAVGRPATTWAFHDPSRHPTDRSNDVKTTVITTTGNDPVELEKLMTSSKLNGS
jgi:hypothetical protein